MQVTETSTEGLKRTLKVVVPASELAKRFDERLAEVRENIQIKGFRKGKVPLGHLKKVYGRSVMAEVVQKAVEDNAAKALTDREERPAMQPELKFSENESEIAEVIGGRADLAFEMSFEALPKVPEIDFTALKLERLVADVDDAAVAKALAGIAERNVRYEAEDGRAASDGDQVTIDFAGSIDGVPFDGGKGEGMQLVLGAGEFIPGFEDGVKGAKAGEERSVKATFPKAYPVEELAGKEATFAVKVKAVAKPIVPAVDDDLAKSFGVEGLDELRKLVRSRIESEYAEVSRVRLKRALLDELDRTHSFALPECLVVQEAESIYEQMTRELARSGKTLASEGKTEDDVRAEFRKVAERRVRLGLILAAMGDRAKVEVTREDLRNALFEEARRYPGQERMVYEYFEKTPGAVQQLRAPIYEDKVVDHVISLVKPSERRVSADDLMKMPDVMPEAAPPSGR